MSQSNELCRLCLDTGPQMLSIFHMAEGKMEITDLIKQHLQLRIFANDSFSTSICKACYYSLQSFNAFCGRVEDAQTRIGDLKNSSAIQERSYGPTQKPKNNTHNFTITELPGVDPISIAGLNLQNEQITPDSIPGTMDTSEDQHTNTADNFIVILQEITEMNTKLDALLEFKNTSNKSTEAFPLKDEYELAELEKRLTEENADTYVIILRRMINNLTMHKSLTTILSKDIILKINVEGQQNKLALKAYPKILDVLFRSYEINTFPCFLTELRMALKRIKNRYHKAKCLSKKMERQHAHQPPDDSTVFKIEYE